MYWILFLWHKLGNGAGRTVGKYGAGRTVGKYGAGRTVGKYGAGRTAGKYGAGRTAGKCGAGRTGCTKRMAAGIKIIFVNLSSKFFGNMNFSGIIVGAATFLIIGVCHPIVIKMEYYWGKGSWWLFLLAGLAFVAASIFVDNDVVATILGAAAFSCFWGIKEMFEQERRVLKGWFPENPARHDYYETIRKADCGGSTGSPTAPAGRQARRSNLSPPK